MRIGTVLIGAAALIVVGVGGVGYTRYFTEREPTVIADPLEHFKYGSIGAEVDGLPYAVWRVLPTLAPDKFPSGWATFGFIAEPGRELPVGLSVRKYRLERIGFNCAVCHTTLIEGHDGLILGAPAAALDLQAYLRTLAGFGADPRFTTSAIIAAIKADDPSFDWLDQLAYRFVVIPQLREALGELTAGNAWMDKRAPHGPGRTDAGNPWRQRFGLQPANDEITGATDTPHIWKQAPRLGKWAHWDGNNGSLTERNLSAALAGGASEDSLDHASIDRVAQWSLVAPPPAYPFAVDAVMAKRGEDHYVKQGCGACHDETGEKFAEATPIAEIGTDRDRYDVFSQELLTRFGSVGAGKPWQFKNYRKSEGYVNLPLDGIWARAPFLHNGSVPTLTDLFLPPANRLPRFYHGCRTFDSVNVGYICSAGFLFDTTLRGNSSAGHDYGTSLTPDERADLVEFLKTR